MSCKGRRGGERLTEDVFREGMRGIGVEGNGSNGMGCDDFI